MRLLYGLPFLLIFSSCQESLNKEPGCTTCSEANYDSEVVDQYFAVYGSDTNAGLVLIDSTSGAWQFYNVCDSLFRGKNGLEYTKIINVTGELFNNCEKSGQNTLQTIKIEEFSVVETCVPEIEVIVVEFDLFRTWEIKEIIIDGQSTLLPCEFQDVEKVSFEKGEEGKNHFASFHGGGEIEIDENSMMWSNGIFVGALFNTDAGVVFEGLFYEVFSGDTSLNYRIENNFLYIVNPISNSQIVLYVNEL